MSENKTKVKTVKCTLPTCSKEGTFQCTACETVIIIHYHKYYVFIVLSNNRLSIVVKNISVNIGRFTKRLVLQHWYVITFDIYMKY